MDGDKTIHVLLLEDDADDYRIVSKQLQSPQCQFVLDWSDCLASAIESLGRRQYDVVLTDLSLPDSSGFATVAAMRKHCQGVPIIVLTGADDESIGRAIVGMGAQDYIVKGDLHDRMLSRAILHAVHRQQSMNEVHELVLELEKSQGLLAQQSQLLKKKNRRLRRLYKTAQEFVDNVSHDLRAPLTVVKSYVSIIREGIVGEINDEQKKLLDKVSVRADDLNNMVDDLLDVSKLESGLLGAWRRNVNIRTIVERAESMLEQRAALANVTFAVECEEGLPEVYCDADKALRVIVNLAVNAIKFSGDEGVVKLSVVSDPVMHQVSVSVTDNGPGIAEESLKKIFDRFHQTGNHIRTTTKGFGLGLSIAEKLCRLNLGEMSVQSQVGVGSTFAFTIPFGNPTEVVRRWLNVHRSKRESIRFVELSVPDETEAGLCDEFDSFLNCLLRRDDILFRAEDNRWHFLMTVNEAEASGWDRRAKKELERANRNRPFGSLPDYQAKTLRHWSAWATNEQVVDDATGLLEAAQEAKMTPTRQE